MSEQHTAAEETIEAAPDTNVSPELEQEEIEPANKAGREAAKYRRQLRDTEAERDGLQAQLKAAQAQIVNSQLSEQELSLMALTGHDPSVFFTDDGALNEEALAETKAQWRKEHASLFRDRRVANTWDRPDSNAHRAPFQQAFGPKK